MSRFITKTLDKLKAKELYLIYNLRVKVFVVEQNCVYQDVDEKDLIAHHVLFFHKKVLCAYARVLPPHLSHRMPSIGRVVVDPDYRDLKYGQLLMKHCIAFCHKNYKGLDVVISAQSYLLKFYESLGFKKEGKGYLEDNIPHIKMRLNHI